MRNKLDQINNAGSKGLISLAANKIRFAKRINIIIIIIIIKGRPSVNFVAFFDRSEAHSKFRFLNRTAISSPISIFDTSTINNQSYSD